MSGTDNPGHRVLPEPGDTRHGDSTSESAVIVTDISLSVPGSISDSSSLHVGNAPLPLADGPATPVHVVQRWETVVSNLLQRSHERALPRAGGSGHHIVFPDIPDLVEHFACDNLDELSNGPSLDCAPLVPGTHPISSAFVFVSDPIYAVFWYADGTAREVHPDGTIRVSECTDPGIRSVISRRRARATHSDIPLRDTKAQRRTRSRSRDRVRDMDRTDLLAELNSTSDALAQVDAHLSRFAHSVKQDGDSLDKDLHKVSGDQMALRLFCRNLEHIYTLSTAAFAQHVDNLQNDLEATEQALAEASSENETLLTLVNQLKVAPVSETADDETLTQQLATLDVHCDDAQEQYRRCMMSLSSQLKEATEEVQKTNRELVTREQEHANWQIAVQAELDTHDCLKQEVQSLQDRNRTVNGHLSQANREIESLKAQLATVQTHRERSVTSYAQVPLPAGRDTGEGVGLIDSPATGENTLFNMLMSGPGHRSSSSPPASPPAVTNVDFGTGSRTHEGTDMRALVQSLLQSSEDKTLAVLDRSIESQNALAEEFMSAMTISSKSDTKSSIKGADIRVLKAIPETAFAKAGSISNRLNVYELWLLDVRNELDNMFPGGDGKNFFTHLVDSARSEHLRFVHENEAGKALFRPNIPVLTKFASHESRWTGLFRSALPSAAKETLKRWEDEGLDVSRVNSITCLTMAYVEIYRGTDGERQSLMKAATDPHKSKTAPGVAGSIRSWRRTITTAVRFSAMIADYRCLTGILNDMIEPLQSNHRFCHKYYRYMEEHGIDRILPTDQEKFLKYLEWCEITINGMPASDHGGGSSQLAKSANTPTDGSGELCRFFTKGWGCRYADRCDKKHGISSMEHKDGCHGCGRKNHQKKDCKQMTANRGKPAPKSGARKPTPKAKASPTSGTSRFGKRVGKEAAKIAESIQTSVDAKLAEITSQVQAYQAAATPPQPASTPTDPTTNPVFQTGQ